nr:uncharacterized protein LOC104649769 [Solanum lycopersicum]
MSEPVPKDRVEHHGQNSRAKLAYSQRSVVHGGSKPPACTKYGRNHSGVCRKGFTGCFKCGETRNFMRKCPNKKQGSSNEGNKSQSSSIAPPDRVAPRGATSSAGGGTNRLYSLNNRQEHENSPDIITDMIQSVPIVKGFQEVFPDDLSRVPPER